MNMKTTILKMTASAITVMLMLISCRNAGAQNDTPTKNAASVTTGSNQSVQQNVKKSIGVTELSSKDFAAKVYDLSKENLSYLGDKPAIIDFYATWCGPCQRIAPILKELAAEYGDRIVIYKVDVDKCPEVAQAFGISSIPAIMYIPLNSEPSMTLGARDKATFQKEISTILLGK